MTTENARPRPMRGSIHAIGAEPRRRGEEPGEWGPPDPAVTAKIMPPPLENLRARGLISIEQYKAAQEIERVFHWVTSGLRTRTIDLDHIRGTASDGTDPLQTAYSARYRPWADALSGRTLAPPDVNQMARVLRSVGENELLRLAAGSAARQTPRRARHHPKTLQIVIEFVIDDRTIETIARDEKHDHRTVKRALLDGLTLYAEIAGWLRRAA